MVFGGLANRAVVGAHAYFLKKKFSNNDAQVQLDTTHLKVSILKAKGAVFTAKGKLRFSGLMGLFSGQVFINLGRNARFQIDNDVVITGCSRIIVAEDGFLRIRGNKTEPYAGVLGGTVAVQKRVEIGVDSMITDGSYLTDSNWHYVEYDGEASSVQSDTILGDHVWVCPNSRVLKGSRIGDNCIVATSSVVNGGVYPSGSLIGGIPAKVIRKNCNWRVALS